MKMASRTSGRSRASRRRSRSRARSARRARSSATGWSAAAGASRSLAQSSSSSKGSSGERRTKKPEGAKLVGSVMGLPRFWPPVLYGAGVNSSLSGRSNKAAARLPPGPRGHLLLGHSPAFTRQRLGFLEQLAREYGDLVSFRLGPKRFVLLNHPRHVEALLSASSGDVRKHYLLRMNRLLLGDGLLVSEGDLWRRQRRLMQPAFQRERVEAYGRVMVEYAERMLSGWRDGEVRDVHAE